jgi:uncharacterized protein YkwD
MEIGNSWNTTRRRAGAVVVLAGALLTTTVPSAPFAHADNKRQLRSIFIDIYTAQQRAGCKTDPRLDTRLVEAARLHTLDVLGNRDLNGDVGSDGSTPQDRANGQGFSGKVAQTVAINPALAISDVEILQQWWYDPVARAIMQDCGNTAIGVWSENSLDRSVVVAVYGQPMIP